jgi:hypothetical protein
MPGSGVGEYPTNRPGGVRLTFHGLSGELELARFELSRLMGEHYMLIDKLRVTPVAICSAVRRYLQGAQYHHVEGVRLWL